MGKAFLAEGTNGKSKGPEARKTVCWVLMEGQGA